MQDGFTGLFAQAIVVLVPMVLSLTVHEFAHAFVAKKLGDTTADAEGRLTLNPLAHVDPIGTIGLPLLILITNAGVGGGAVPFFGWAKPVPVNPARFHRRVSVREGMMWVAAAGPVSNLLMALAVAGILSAFWHGGLLGQTPEALVKFMGLMININIALFLFNLIPVYPLDGQKVLSGLLGPRTSMRFDQFSHQYGWMLLLGIVFFAGEILSGPFRVVYFGLLKVVGLG